MVVLVKKRSCCKQQVVTWARLTTASVPQVHVAAMKDGSLHFDAHLTAASSVFSRLLT
jgi:hypothetical protein